MPRRGLRRLRSWLQFISGYWARFECLVAYPSSSLSNLGRNIWNGNMVVVEEGKWVFASGFDRGLTSRWGVCWALNSWWKRLFPILVVLLLLTSSEDGNVCDRHPTIWRRSWSVINHSRNKWKPHHGRQRSRHISRSRIGKHLRLESHC